MAQEILSGPLGELRAASTAGGGLALTTSAAYQGLFVNTGHVQITGRNFATAVVAQLLRNPYLIVLKTANNLVTAEDFSRVAQDIDATTEVNLDAMDVAANGDYLYVGSHLPFAGVYVDVSADSGEPNGTASVLTVNYWNGVAWTDISATDGTISTAISLAVDGAVSWTVPTAWKAASLVEINSPVPGASVPYRGDVLYWTRWQWGTALDAVVRLDAMYAVNRSTAYAEYAEGQVFEEAVKWGPGGIGCIQAKVNSGTGNLIVNCATRYGGRVV